VFGRESFCLVLLFLFYSQKLKAFTQRSIFVCENYAMKSIIGCSRRFNRFQVMYNPLGNLTPVADRKQSSLEAPHCSAYSMRLSLNYFVVLFLVTSINRFVFVSTTTLN